MPTQERFPPGAGEVCSEGRPAERRAGGRSEPTHVRNVGVPVFSESGKQSGTARASLSVATDQRPVSQRPAASRAYRGAVRKRSVQQELPSQPRGRAGLLGGWADKPPIGWPSLWAPPAGGRALEVIGSSALLIKVHLPRSGRPSVDTSGRAGTPAGRARGCRVGNADDPLVWPGRRPNKARLTPTEPRAKSILSVNQKRQSLHGWPAHLCRHRLPFFNPPRTWPHVATWIKERKTMTAQMCWPAMERLCT
eukprot:366242-Chlamydomonas_euryale.AAC.4